MNYIYENLNDETFQELCHSIINAEFPDSQAFPIGQPDGGRDTIAYELNSSTKAFSVFQVKYVRNPSKIEDVHKWFNKIIEGEAEKIKKLIPKGATKFYLLTNVKGTAHLESGSIDIMNATLSKHIDIPAICWWRDDLNGKLDARVDLRWTYPQILNGQDILNSVMFSNINSEKERKEGVIKAYLADQYQIEHEVKFKQIELESNLFDLFVDVPIGIKEFSTSNAKRNTFIYNDQANKYGRAFKLQDIYDEPNLGAAFFLLSSPVQKNVSKILLEGGPGQGKSTITQFICQVHRAKLLGHDNDLLKIADGYKNNALRLPFKIDLRDLASWISNKNPYSSNLNEEWFTKNYKSSLEAFLIAHIYYHSNIEAFNITDLISICKEAQILIVFDGFDEIADISIRAKIIETINHGIKRLSENIKHIQVIITSRPAAFANSAKFSTDQYPHFQLNDINNDVIKQYLEKWIAGRKMKDREGNEMRRIVQNKLELPHLRDLAKSPMQLAILLSLINTRGESLPNKRTELYDSYIDLFFNRESEKSTLVRNNRDLLINIHRYLAWVLHSEAELYNNNGRIDVSSLKDKLKEYLEKEEHPTTIADQLFTVMEERVCAIVSRVLGTFEFEVQPLREYFCAKYLYDTSPYSPPGKPKSGTLPDRFDALVKNFYWENVLRFFAGCFDRGELPMLIDKLREVGESEYLKNTNYIRLITSELLSDFVFSGYPKLIRDVIKIVTNGINIGSILNVRSQFGIESISLPTDCGRVELVDECFRALSLFPNSDYVDELISLIIENDSDNISKWLDYSMKYIGADLDKWLIYGRRMQVLFHVNDEILKNIITKDGDITDKRLRILLESNKSKLIEDNAEWKKQAVEAIFKGKINNYSIMPKSFSYYGLCVFFNPFILKSIFNYSNHGYNLSYSDFLLRRIAGRRLYNDKDIKAVFNVVEIRDNIDAKVNRFYQEIQTTFDIDIQEWSTSIEPWSMFIDTAENYFGTKWIFKVAATVGAGIKSTEATFSEILSLHSIDFPLTHRVRAARLRSGHVPWWRNELSSTTDKNFSLLVFFTWCTAKTIIETAKIADGVLSSLTGEELNELNNSYKKTAGLSYFNILQQKQVIDTLKSEVVSDSFLYFISFRFPESTRSKFIKFFFNDYRGSNLSIIEVKLDFLLKEFFETEATEELLPQIKALYERLSHHKYYSPYINNNKIIPYNVAKKIMEDCKSYPKFIVSAAESACRFIANQHAIAVGRIAISEKWFDE